MDKWEYKQVTVTFTYKSSDYDRPGLDNYQVQQKVEKASAAFLIARLNELGREGWELIGGLPGVSRAGVNRDDNEYREYVVNLKRRVSL